ncbi:MAG TPA: hypothetical protein VF346_07840 [Bacteroidales bacterium]
MKRKLSLTLLVLSILSLNSIFSYSQEKLKINPYIQLQYFKDNNENSFLKTTLTYSRNRMELPLPGMKIIFYSGPEKKTRLAEIITDDKGIAIFNLINKSDFFADKNGFWPFRSVFDGNDTIESGISELMIRDVKLNMTLTKIDSIKTIGLNAKKMDKGKEIPVSGEKVTLYVPRMFSLLPIGEATLDESGSASIEFPATLPGDKEGNITIIARIEDNAEFGNVEKKSTLKWGLPSTYSVPAGHRALWTKTAPKWMIYTLSVLLSGVWGHYLFALISLIRIRLAAKKKAKEEYRV